MYVLNSSYCRGSKGIFSSPTSNRAVEIFKTENKHTNKQGHSGPRLICRVSYDTAKDLTLSHRVFMSHLIQCKCL